MLRNGNLKHGSAQLPRDQYLPDVLPPLRLAADQGDENRVVLYFILKETKE